MKGLSLSSVLHKSMELDVMDLREPDYVYVFERLISVMFVGCGKPNAQNAVK